MDEDSLKLLCTGDLHLGRHPTRIPGDLDGPEFSPRSVWLDIVRDAISCEVDAVVLTGDIADRENRYFEAYGAFEAGVIELDEAGIPIIVVAGNHDSEFLPRMVNDIQIDNLHLLGEGGKWGRWTLERDGVVAAHFDGWSFPHQHVSTSPLQQYDLPEADDAPQIGVLHAELDSPRSQYAPVDSSELRSTSGLCWLLGHIHVPGIQIDSDPLVLYPGSPQALDPGERGIRGPWLVSIGSDGKVETEQKPLGTVCYDEIQVDVSGVEDSMAAGAEASAAIQQYVQENLNTRNMAAFLPRVRFIGRTSAHTDLVEDRQTLIDQLVTKHGSVDIHIESVTIDTRPDIDLEAVAEGDGPVSYLAELLLTLRDSESNEEYNQLVDEAHEAMQRAYSADAYNLLRREANVDQPERKKAVELIEQEARIALDTLLRQKEYQT